ncbi:Glutathione-regulated potassium-efflux system protein KefC [Planctomycetes bacterium Poly30]|uniref:Glutathione-regulated potassium-efflux system protein KefC n=1 Tax=Saltatorellus ferox TaxID=2528018 RepID=A0A518EQW3_9BACT|nr:Glutathione-regulated potassium-efflux system protein KefC [Planctomycetes bacterium Poly30]
MGPLNDAFIYLLAAVIAVPLAKRLGLGSVLGYLLSGVVIGPGLGLVGSETEDIQHFAEFGVVMMLFLVGLELRPSMLWEMRGKLLGLGGLQVVFSVALLGGAAMAMGVPWQTSLAIGMTLALSSTAIVLQTLGEKSWLKSPAGQSAFSVLLFQDIAVIPMLAVIPLLAVLPSSASIADGHHGSGLDALPGWAQAPVIVGVMVGIVVAGRFLVRPVFRFIAAARLREIFTAAALLLVIGVAILMTKIGLSPALGTFLAGVVLSDSEYRHELEGNIEPFKGLLLGLFFLTVGAGIDFALIADAPGTIFGIAIGIMLVKLLVVLGVGRIFGMRGAPLWLLGLSLAQAGEFAFVLFGFARSSGVIEGDLTRLLILAVAVTMMLTPLLFLFYEHVVAPRSIGEPERPADSIDEHGSAVVAGVGRFGVVVSRMLVANGQRVVVLDHSADRIELLRKIGIKAYFGNATRSDLLEAAGLHEAQLFVAALDDHQKQVELVELVRRQRPDIHIIARAFHYEEVIELERAGAQEVIREVRESAIAAGRQALVAMGVHPFKAERQSRSFRLYDDAIQNDLRAYWTENGMDAAFVSTLRARVAGLSALMESDRLTERHDSTSRGWTPPPKDDNRLLDGLS